MLQGKKHFDVLDGFRGLAVLLVMMSHSSGRDMPLASWLNFTGIGHIGVYLFFVLSGYLLTRNLMAGQTSLQFYLRRIFRIVPLYFFVLAGVLVYQSVGYYWPRYLHITGGAEGALLHFLFLKGDGVFWTLAAEFGFYALLPFIHWGLIRFGWHWLAFTAAIYFCAFLVEEKFRLGMPLKFVDISHRGQFLDVFSCGILAAYLPASLFARTWSDKWVPALFCTLLSLTLVCVSANFMGAQQPAYGLRWLSLSYGAVFGLAIVCGAEGAPALSRVLGNPILAFMGKIGFGLYLLHFPVFQAINTHIGAPPVIRFFLAIPVAMGVAWLAYQLIERPMVRLGHQLEVSLGIGVAKVTHAQGSEMPTKTV